MTSYQKNIHTFSNFTSTPSSTYRSKKAQETSHNSTFDITLASRAKKSTNGKKKTSAITRQKEKIYSASGQAPAPSKDFYELCVYREQVIWRKWRIKYTRDGKVVPSEDKMDIERFLDSDVVQNDIERNLGDDVLNMAIGRLTKLWLSRLPMRVLVLITSFMDLKEIGILHQVSTNFNKRLKKDAIWKNRLQQDFEITADDLNETEKRKTLKRIYKEEVQRRKEAEIDWDNV